VGCIALLISLRPIKGCAAIANPRIGGRSGFLEFTLNAVVKKNPGLGRVP